MTEELSVFDYVGDEDDTHEFRELMGEFFHKDPYELNMKDWVTRLITQGVKQNNKQALVELIREEYSIDMDMDDFVEVKTLSDLWKFINEAMLEEEVIPNEEFED